MAVLESLISAQVVDGDGEVTSTEQPFFFDTATATFAQVVTWIQGWGAALDLITDGKITKLRVSITIPLPSGIKTAAVANSDNEKTGLFTMNANGTTNAYGDDVPAFPAAKFTGNQINLADAQVAAYVTYITTPTATTLITPTDRYGNQLLSVKRGRKTFRKHRRALARA